MATQSHRKFMAYEEFAALPREGMITMLLDGEYIVAPSPVRRHQELIARLFEVIRAYLRAKPIGEVYFAPLDVVLSKPRARVIQPDILFVAGDAESRWEDGILIGMPDLAVEILSKDMNRYDKGRKLEYYDEYGVRELWHVHQQQPRIEVFRREPAGRLAAAVDLGPGGTLASEVLPGLEIAIDELFANLP